MQSVRSYELKVTEHVHGWLIIDLRLIVGGREGEGSVASASSLISLFTTEKLSVDD